MEALANHTFVLWNISSEKYRYKKKEKWYQIKYRRYRIGSFLVMKNQKYLGQLSRAEASSRKKRKPNQAGWYKEIEAYWSNVKRKMWREI